LDRSGGASQLSRKALDVLKFLAQNSKKETYGSFVEDFKKVGKRLLQAKPNMAPVQNLVAQIVYEVDNLLERDLVLVRNLVISRIEEISKESKAAVKKAAVLGATIIAESDYLTTCSYSSTVCETLKVAKQQGKSFKVFVSESRTDDNKFQYGRILAKLLKSSKISTEVFPDDKIHKFVPKTKYVLVGADSLLRDGSIINGAPTYKVALKAKEFGIPLYSVCETTKANTLNYVGKNIELKEGFELVHSNLITGIMTEKGILDTRKIVEIMKEKSKFLEALIN
jgi:translation initiation factor eIF-2B subunit delta